MLHSLPLLSNRGSFVGFITTFLIDCLCFLPALGIFVLSHLLAVIRLLFFKLVRGVVWDHVTIVKLNSLQCLALGSLVPFKTPFSLGNMPECFRWRRYCHWWNKTSLAASCFPPEQYIYYFIGVICSLQHHRVQS